MAEAKILRVVEELDTYLTENANSINRETTMNVEVVESLRNELRSILDFVADKNLEERSSLKYWMFDVLEIAEDALLLTHGEFPFYYELKTMCRVLGEAKNRILQLGVEGANESVVTTLSPQEGDENVVGLEEHMKSMLREPIFRHGKYLFATCIMGMPGIGKTTLARKLYDHPTTVDRYELRAWICVSDEWSNKEVLMKLILQLRQTRYPSFLLKKMEDADNKNLQGMLHRHLQGKRFLIVLDNIGKIPYFDSIFKSLPIKAYTKSRLVLTSRFRSVENMLPSHVGVIGLEMKPLDHDQSWQLFLKLLLFGNQLFPKKLEKKGREMLRSCNGLPLSIKEVATQFVTKRQSGSEWEELLESIDLSATFVVLESVYRRWPPQLKSCFLCLSFFKKGTPISREKLVQVWSAGQVIPHEEEGDQDFEESDLDFLEGYKTTLMKLLDESIIEVELSRNTCIKCIRVNPSFYTLSVAKAHEEMILETLGRGNPPSTREPPHRAIYCSRNKFNHFTDHDEHLVSLFFRGGGYFDASEPNWKHFRQLRTLDFEGFGLKILPDIIGALTELRYLGLRDNYILELPRSLERLKNLEVLDIALNFTLEVPDILWEINSLRHLYMSDIICRKPLKIDTLKNLETLTYISVDNWIYEISSLKMMTSLRKLGIEEVDENSDVSKLFASLANLRNLDFLILKGFRFRSFPPLHGLQTLRHVTELRLDGLITKLPSADTFPPNLYYLSLINSSLDEDPMPELGKLYYLRYLKLKNAYTGQEMVISTYTLEVLSIEELWHLRDIHSGKYTARLLKLEIKSCPNLENITKDIFSYRTEELKISRTRKLAAKIRKLDFISKIEHVDIQP